MGQQTWDNGSIQDCHALMVMYNYLEKGQMSTLLKPRVYTHGMVYMLSVP